LDQHQRSILFIGYNAIDNALREVENPRPEWLANRNPVVVQSLDAGFMAAS